MSDDYLWDGAGSPAPGEQDVVRLERMLGQLRTPLPPVPNIAVAQRFVTAEASAKAVNAAAPTAAAATTRFLAPASHSPPPLC